VAYETTVSRRRNAEARISVLSELRDVFDSMRTLSLVEIAKLSRSEPARHRLQHQLTTIAQVSAPYFNVLGTPPGPTLSLLVGSERGFCAGFNEGVTLAWDRIHAVDPNARAVVVGSMLAEKLNASSTILDRLSGPTVFEDIDASLIAVLHSIARFEARARGPIALWTVANGRDGIETTAILPFEPPRSAHGQRTPALNLAPASFIDDFVDQYADAALHGVFATSLLSENRARLAHMTSAIERLDENVALLRRQTHRLRQEEITEEVETILLSTQADQSR